jgi:branched-subunit amino acid transport protein
MSVMWPILGMAAAVYAVRLGGLMLADMAIPPGWERTPGFVPVAMLTTLVVGGLAGRPGGGVTDGVALAGAGLVAWRSRRGWLAIPVGLAISWLLRWLGA